MMVTFQTFTVSIMIAILPAVVIPVVVAILPALVMLVTISVVVTVAVGMLVPVIVFVVILIVVAGQCETAEHQRHRDCQCCHPHAAHIASHPAPSFEGLDCNHACPRVDTWNRFTKTSDANANYIGCIVEHIFSNLKRTLNLSLAITWE
jgi:ABC-type multidrug transport system fused ATPase/permease subunit